MGKTKRRKCTKERTRFNNCDQVALSEVDEQEILEEFNKTFEYIKKDIDVSPWRLPETDQLFSVDIWEDEELRTMKNELNRVKDLLSDKDINEWHEHTKLNHRAGKTISSLRHSIQPEICTQAWCKFFEIVSRYPIVPSHIAQFMSLHLCEAPGAFISALNHYLKTHRPYIDWHWIGNTLNPYYEGNGLRYMIDNDILIRDTLDCWYFGHDNSGDITSTENIQNLKNEVKNQVHLVTADGSFNCQNNPAEQEKLVSHLHFCELLAALSVLSNGGSLVIKMFTFFEAESVCQMYLLNCLFNQVHVFKPSTSKPGNSEVYVICLDFHGLNNVIHQALLSSLGQIYEEKAMLPYNEIPKSFLDQHRLCCERFMDFQIKTIRCNMETFGSRSRDEHKQLENLRDGCVQHFIRRYLVKPISNHDRIIPRRCEKNKRGQLRFAHERLHGTYNYRRHVNSSSWQKRIASMSYRDEDDIIYIIENNFEPMTKSEISSWNMICGKPIGHILSSKFCSQALLDEYNELMENSQELMNSFVTPDNGDIQKRICESIVSVAFTDPVHYQLTDISPKPSNLSLSMSVELNSQTSSNCERDVTSIFIADVTSKNQMNELSSQPDFLSSAIRALTSLEPGGYFIVKSCPAYTRFSIGLIWLLSKCFHRVFVDMFGESANNGYQYIICAKFIGHVESITEYLQQVERCVNKRTNSHETVLQFVPILNMLDAQFLDVMRSINNKNLVKYINHLIKLNKSTF
ncbi:cap-specific mRNA (nucleoside-2'-O-)-methyltransferase 2-like [Tubulanus polymorphus]|uniref:cap-specific mRNA (nucleoside-2'-O-)-methyltransferase 2-like n=1 Tax=Tubulanus polymorphus TaxID=672921 RepID=UPI003DA4CF79